MSVTAKPHKLLIFFLLLTSFSSRSQFYPANGNHLNFTSVCFEFPWMNKAVSYQIRLINEQTKETTTYTCESNKLVVNDLSFGSSYSWSVSALDRRKNQLSVSPMTRFTIDAYNREHLRFRGITNNERKRSSELMIFDYSKVMIDHDLETVWFLPSLPFLKSNSGLRDLKLTQDGTFLVIIDSNAYELSPTGKILWKAPNDGQVSGGTGEDYHHDLQKLPSGNYMVLGNETVKRAFPGKSDSVKFQIGTIIEYSPKGKVVWEWHAKDFFTNEVLARAGSRDKGVGTATHMNALSVDGTNIYIGFRDVSWILKIDKTTKKVTEIYGGPDSGRPNHYAKGLFRFQHSATLLRDGSMAIINNDSIKDPAVFSSMVIFSLGEAPFGKGEERFRFLFNYDSLSSGKTQKMGNVSQLKNGNFLINMGSLNRVCEITPKGEVVWDLFVEKHDSVKESWKPFSQYRVAVATSLYPNEFSAKWEPDAAKGNYLDGKLTIYNVGSEPNSYSVFSEHRDGSKKLLATLPVVLPQQSTQAAVSIPRELISEQTRIVIRVNEKSYYEVLNIENW